jgi:hypothetical protein
VQAFEDGKLAKYGACFYVPFAKIVLRVRSQRDDANTGRPQCKVHQNVSEKLVSRESTNTRWSREMMGRKSCESTAGHRRGAKKELRSDRTWDDFAMLPPLIYTKHAQERRMERGEAAIPRFVAGTHKTLVATVVYPRQWIARRNRIRDEKRQDPLDKRVKKVRKSMGAQTSLGRTQARKFGRSGSGTNERGRPDGC